MTKSDWRISDAKARFSEMVQASSQAPQLLYSRNKSVAASIGMGEFHAHKRYLKA